jgi:heme-degrading monooxygenase HmoA
MYGRVTRLEGSPDQIEQGNQFMEQTILPAARQLEGFRGVLSLTDRANGRGLTVTLWDTEEAMQASEEAANRLRDEAARAFGGTIVGVDRYEVTFSELV